MSAGHVKGTIHGSSGNAALFVAANFAEKRAQDGLATITGLVVVGAALAKTALTRWLMKSSDKETNMQQNIAVRALMPLYDFPAFADACLARGSVPYDIALEYDDLQDGEGPQLQISCKVRAVADFANWRGWHGTSGETS